ncbi:MAG TPA: hypothetical protein VKC54_03620 [Patescibacteria group bacterium]|nr:hypothetical protein [Patescibacteria group bacterium]
MGTLVTDGFGPGDDEKVVSILNKWKGGVLSDQLFTAISKMTPQVAAIIVVFRKRGDTLETLLLPRPENDPLWAGMLNLPGKMFRTVDFNREDKNPINGPLERILKDELKINFTEPPKFAGLAFQDTKRGPIVVLVHTAYIPVDFNGNEDWVWRDVAKLKEFDDMIPTEMPAIEVALKAI